MTSLLLVPIALALAVYEIASQVRRIHRVFDEATRIPGSREWRGRR